MTREELINEYESKIKLAPRDQLVTLATINVSGLDMLHCENELYREFIKKLKKLNVATESEDKVCATCGKPKRSKGDGTLQLLCECGL